MIRRVASPEDIARGICYDRRNAFQIGAPFAMSGVCQCHASHHHPGVNDGRIAYALLPGEAKYFARLILGDAAPDYLRRHYRGAPQPDPEEGS